MTRSKISSVHLSLNCDRGLVALHQFFSPRWFGHFRSETLFLVHPRDTGLSSSRLVLWSCGWVLVEIHCFGGTLVVELIIISWFLYLGSLGLSFSLMSTWSPSWVGCFLGCVSLVLVVLGALGGDVFAILKVWAMLLCCCTWMFERTQVRLCGCGIFRMSKICPSGCTVHLIILLPL